MKRLSKGNSILIALFGGFLGYMASVPFQAMKIRRIQEDNAKQVQSLKDNVEKARVINQALEQTLKEMGVKVPDRTDDE
jgi:hypothetical protein